MRNVPAADHPHEFVGGSLALDFTNTLGGSHRAPDHEHLQRYEDLVDFAVQGGAISPAEARPLKAAASRDPSRARQVLRRGTALREALWRLFEAKAVGRSVESKDLAAANHEIGQALGHARLVARAADFSWGWDDEISLERPLWPIARSAADLISSSEALAELRECASDTCEWLFLDRSRNHTRRWCAMNDCGARAKVRRFRQRHRAPTAKASR